jgi:hypothetical protein
VGCCASAKQQEPRKKTQSERTKGYDLDLPIENPKPLLGEVEVSENQNGFIGSPDLPLPVRSAES